MSKLQLTPSPTFKATVGIPQAGGDPVPVEMTFKHRTKDQLDEFVRGRPNKTDVQSFMDMVVGWDLEDAFNKKSVEKLLQNYIGSALATFHKYIDELVQAKAKN